MSEADAIRRFVREALPFLSSYFYSEQVQLEPARIEFGDGDGDEEYAAFANLIRMRHAVACGIKLKPILELIKRGHSQSSEIVRSESKGAISGRLDIPLYLNRRGTNLAWPRTFPVLINQATATTPENRLVVIALRQMVARLNSSSQFQASAERIYCRNLLRWGRQQLHSEPWASIGHGGGATRLLREVEHRLRKRQTGNEPAYSQFLAWYRQWSLDASRAGPEDSEDLVDLLLAFPPGDFFGDRVFEIWCLYQVVNSFRRAGAEYVDGPRPLAERTGRSVCAMTYNGYRFEVWFQKALPSGAARWKYTGSDRYMAGIPDITVIGSDGRRLLIDAKRREVRTRTRSEETYKMLGYRENFRSIFDGSPFWGALCFLSDSELFTEISSEDKHRITLIGAHASNAHICAFGGRMDTLLSEWLSQMSTLNAWESIHAPTQLM